MKRSDIDIGRVLADALAPHAPQTPFETIWQTHTDTSPGPARARFRARFVKRPALVAASLLACLSLAFAGWKILRRVDKVDYPFVDDPRVIGRWEAVDFVERPNDFVPGKKAWRGDLSLRTLVFLRHGATLAAGSEGNGNLRPSSFDWTSGLILNKSDRTAGRYEIRELAGSPYLFFEWKSGDYSFRGRTPAYYVLRQADTRDYTSFRPAARADRIDYPFVDDPGLLGRWVTVDFVSRPADFDPAERRWPGDLFLTGFEIRARGKMTGSFENGKYQTDDLAWTRGLVINARAKTASRVEYRTVGGTTWLFYEWKSGDYTLGGMKPKYYVLKKSP
jgi:bla regulator protein BlaR1